MEPVLQWAAPCRTGSHTKTTTSRPCSSLLLQQVSEKCSKSDNLVYEGGLLWDKLVDASVEVPPKTGFHFLYALYTPRHLTHYEQVT